MKFNDYIFIFTIFTIISFAILPITTQNYFTYYDIPTVNASKSTPTIFDIINYSDNKIILRIIRPDLSIPSEEGLLWLDKYLSLRTIYPDGKVVPIDIKLDIQDFNFCLTNEVYGIGSPIKIYPIRSKFLLVTYAEAADLNDPFTYIEKAMVIDLNGNIYGNTTFKSTYVDVVTNQWLPDQAGIFVNYNSYKGFLRVIPITNTSDFGFERYEVTGDGNILFLVQDILNFKESLSLMLTAIPMVDGRYAIVYANSTDSEVTSIIPQEGLYILILEYDKETEREPAVLYQTTIHGLKFTDINCDVSYVGIGQVCIVTGEYTIGAVKETIYFKFDFLSCGTAYNFKPLKIQTNPLIEYYAVQLLPYGGYLLSGIGSVDNITIVYGYVFNDDGEVYSWNLPNIVESNVIAGSTILRNNTFVLARVGEKPRWALITTELHKFNEDRDHGYNNFHIASTTPSIDDMIPSDLEFLNIKYYNKVELSNGNITIFQDDGNIRQTTSGINGRYVSYGDDTTIKVAILKSTFNQPGRRYYVSIDNNSVKDKIYQEPLYGVNDHVWSFTTTQTETEISSDDVMGQVRLTPEGTSYFLYEADREVFLMKLKRELADAIPVNPNRITTNEGFEIDTSVSQKQIFLSIDIKKMETEQERSVSLAIMDLDSLIKNKPITVIASGESTSYLDEDYGYKTLPNWRKTYGSALLGIFAITLVLICFFFYAKRKNADAKNTVIFQLGIIIFDVIMDITFIITKAKNIEALYIPSILFTIGPFIISVIIAFVIIKKEEKMREFFEWSRENKKVVDVFTVLAGSEVELLTILESKVIIGGNIVGRLYRFRDYKRVVYESADNDESNVKKEP
ncbi:8152_t:CDS:2 [Funneliformis mosseae]|uniref:8152_t:CDS:1 n=1 Tax=Funneliformis mosseae TaxID=27381 RepID=A0A9N9A5V8_FUNMO|nr:8152_t:CDS:2 [Funneliformis mosseae]